MCWTRTNCLFCLLCFLDYQQDSSQIENVLHWLQWEAFSTFEIHFQRNYGKEFISRKENYGKSALFSFESCKLLRVSLVPIEHFHWRKKFPLLDLPFSHSLEWGFGGVHSCLFAILCPFVILLPLCFGERCVFLFVAGKAVFSMVFFGVAVLIRHSDLFMNTLKLWGWGRPKKGDEDI